MPKDIEPDILEKDSGKGEGSPKADKPLSLSATKETPEAVKHLSPRSIEDTPDASKPPSLADNEEINRTSPEVHPEVDLPSSKSRE
jgi:hypothetical protein